MGIAKKMRLDDLLLSRELAPSKSMAKSMIMAGKVRSGTVILDKPGKAVPSDIEISLTESFPYVSRGALKIKSFLDKFPIPIQNSHILDVGASTGGFTDFLLQNGATDATCVDVGHGQLHYKLRKDPRVTNIERTNARDLKLGDLPREAYDLIVMDLSFISLKTILPCVWPFLAPDAYLISLIKPQFEAGKAEVDKGQGVIRDPKVRERVVNEIKTFVTENLESASHIGICPSEIHGADGNLEYLAGWRKLK